MRSIAMKSIGFSEGLKCLASNFTAAVLCSWQV